MELNLEKQNWQMRMAATSCSLTSVYKAPCNVEHKLECKIFMEGVSEKLFPLPVQEEDGYVYAVLGKKHAVIMDYKDDCEQLTIPAMIAGRRVLAVSGMGQRRNLKTISMENGILQICAGFLNECPALETVEMPASLVRTAKEFCVGCENIKEYKISGPSMSVSVKDGVLFDESKRILIRYPAGREAEVYEIPERVKMICPRAFSETIHLKKIIVPQGAEKIGEYAFSGSTKVVELPDTLLEIGKNVFFMSEIEQIIICGKAGSFVENYAAEHGIAWKMKDE